VAELGLAGITTIEAANAFLPGFLLRHNERFAMAAADPTTAWRSWPDGLTAASVFCFHYPRRVARDATVSWGPGALSLPRRRDGRSWAGREVVLEERLDGSLWVRHNGEHYPVAEAPAAPTLLRARSLSRRAAEMSDEGTPIATPPAILPLPRPGKRQPASGHPWRR